MSNDFDYLDSSFRDPAGFVFKKNGDIYRQINETYKYDFIKLIESGLYETLTKKGLLIRHEEVSFPDSCENGYKIIKPEQISFISYPYEWSISQLKDAALVTLEIQEIALSHGMSLKDASAFNIQFIGATPVFIDTLSFETYRENEPWVAYRQFCQHFLGPLLLMKYCHYDLGKLFVSHIDGIPLDLTSKLLPLRTYLMPSALIHIHLHAKSQQAFSKKTSKPKGKFSVNALKGLIDNLKVSVKKIGKNRTETEWGKYYENTNYTEVSFLSKKEIIESYIDKIKPKSVWDFGANKGVFSRMTSRKGIQTIAFDIDPVAVDDNYLNCVAKEEKNLTPLVFNIINPSPAIGWACKERASLCERAPVDMVMALALIHHLAISNNLPFIKIAEFFSAVASSLIIEFVPKSDSQVNILLATREDIFDEYHEEGFEKAFAGFYELVSKTNVQDSSRTIYCYQRRR